MNLSEIIVREILLNRRLYIEDGQHKTVGVITEAAFDGTALQLKYRSLAEDKGKGWALHKETTGLNVYDVDGDGVYDPDQDIEFISPKMRAVIHAPGAVIIPGKLRDPNAKPVPLEVGPHKEPRRRRTQIILT
jgi:hypothetical protein